MHHEDQAHGFIQLDDRHLEQAREELTDGEIAPNDILLEADALNDRAKVLGGSGVHVLNMGLGDENAAGETLVDEGLNDALHEEMRQSAR